MPDEFTYDVFLIHRTKDKALVRSASLSASNGDLSSLGNCERNLPEAKAPCGPSERGRASHWAGVRCRRLHLAERPREAGLPLWFRFHECEISVASVYDRRKSRRSQSAATAAKARKS